ncbi:MAG: hypothetical protein KatS3mg060_1330 [Dehalococcoidia bacterium]|nr:MAG: hypothetical protein KatS3mg060_1330 [Dehalococcoidia bacterium]
MTDVKSSDADELTSVCQARMLRLMPRLFMALLLVAIALPLAIPSASAQSSPIRRFMYMHVFTTDTLRLLQQRIGQLDAVSPVYFTVEEGGEVSGRDSPGGKRHRQAGWGQAHPAGQQQAAL